jgi:hypothetical protein
MVETSDMTYMDLVKDYAKQFEDNMSEKVVYQMAKDNLIDKKAMRNRAIIQDYDAMVKGGKMSMADVYEDLCFKYNLSLRMIQEIVWKK